MKGHLDADVLAEYRAWLITGRRYRAITAHLSGCAECAALDARLAQVSVLLAAAPAPSLPDAVARRLDDALAAEVQRPIPAERHSVPARQRRFPSLAGRLRVRVLAPAAATLAILAGGGYALSQAGGGSSASGPSANAGAARGAASHSSNAYGAASGATSGAGSASLGPERHDEVEPSAGFDMVTSDLDFGPATLKSQVAAQLLDLSSLRATPATTKVAACVQRITRGATPVLIEQASYRGRPATVIVVAQGGSDLVWVAGQSCSATNSDVLDHTVLTPGISAP